MAEDNTIVQPTVTPDPQKATEAAPNSGQGSEPFDPSKLPDDQVLKVLEDPRLWKSERLSKLREQAKKAEDFEKAETKRQEEEQIKKGDYEKVIQTKDQRIAELESQISGSKTDNAIITAANKAGAVDANAIIKLIDRSGITIGDDGTVAGVEEAVTALLEASPYLKGAGATPKIGNPSNPSGADQAIRSFKASQLRDPVFYKENEAEIMKAFRAGKIEDDEASKQ